MKVSNLSFSSIQDLSDNLNLLSFDRKKTLLQVFTGLITENEILKICSIIKEKKNNIQFIGSSTAGEISNKDVQENSILVSIMEFENTTFNLNYFLNENDIALGIDIASSLFVDTTKAMILFIDGLKTNGNDVLDGISSVNNKIPVAGGMAGDNGSFVETFVFCNKGVYNKGAVAVSLNSEILNVFTDYQLNWQPIGQEMIVTKAEKNRLYEIDGISASEIYRKYLGDKVGDNLPFSATEFPLLKIQDDKIQICRTFVQQFEDGSLLTIGNLEVGDKLRLAFGNVDLVLNSTKSNIENYQSIQPEAIYTYSCTARRSFLQSEVFREIAPLEEIAPTSGFFTYGEIFHKNNKNSLLNISLTILGLSEKDFGEENSTKDKANLEVEKNFVTNKHFLVLDALTHLSNSVIEELEESKKAIESTHKRMKDSIEYASLIQNAILPEDLTVLSNYCKDHFVFLKQRDTVGGDIYFIHELANKEEIIIMLIDGAGHGVSGAFVTMLVKAIQTQIVAKIDNKELESNPALILEYFNVSIKTMLKQEKGSQSNAGFDGGILYYNKRTNKCTYAGAKTPIYVINDNNVEYIKSDRKNVGFVRTDINQKYTNYDIEIKTDTKLYLATDGIIDQEGSDGNRYGRTRFEDFIKENKENSCSSQKDKLIDNIASFMKGKHQSDDITIIGLKF